MQSEQGAWNEPWRVFNDESQCPILQRSISPSAEVENSLSDEAQAL
jgi:hypothetical protein